MVSREKYGKDKEKKEEKDKKDVQRKYKKSEKSKNIATGLRLSRIYMWIVVAIL
jgi:hypothetical protein